MRPELLKYRFYRKKPYPYQVKALERALELDSSCALWMDPGTGKTRVVIDFCGIKYEAGTLHNVLIVCPLAAMKVWEAEIKKWLPPRIPRRVIRLDLYDGNVRERARVIKNLSPSSSLTFLIINYDIIGKRVKRVGNTNAYDVPVRDAVRAWHPDLIVADESHLIKHHTARRSRALHSLAVLPRWRFALSGTPITNSPFDVFSQYLFLDRSIFGSWWTAFKYTYGVWGGYMGYELLKYKNQELLAQKMNSIAYRVSIDELHLPKPVYQELYLDAAPRTRAIYNQMAEQFIVWLHQEGTCATAAIKLTQLLRCSQLTGGFIRDEEGKDIHIGSEKFKVLQDLLNTYAREGQEKVVVFARFRWELAQIEKVCQKLKLPFVRHNLETDPQRFAKDPRIKVFIAQLAKGGIAVNDLVVARIAIFYSLDYSSDHLRQAEGRLYRSGQKRKPLFLFLLMKDTIDVSMYESLRKRRDLAKLLVDDWEKLVKGEKLG